MDTKDVSSSLDAALALVAPDRRRFLGLLLAGVATAPLLTSAALAAESQQIDENSPRLKTNTQIKTSPQLKLGTPLKANTQNKTSPEFKNNTPLKSNMQDKTSPLLKGGAPLKTNTQIKTGPQLKTGMQNNSKGAYKGTNHIK
jgi:hypothetical protein